MPYLLVPVAGDVKRSTVYSRRDGDACLSVSLKLAALLQPRDKAKHSATAPEKHQDRAPKNVIV
jgi:hypothetical protein